MQSLHPPRLREAYRPRRTRASPAQTAGLFHWEPLAADTFERQGTTVRGALIVVEVRS